MNLRTLMLSTAATALALAAISPAAAVANDPTPAPTGAEISHGRPPALHVPQPTGAHPVGTTSLHLLDRSRPDPWVPSTKRRELVVSMYYPALLPLGRPAQYMTDRESRTLLQGLAEQGQQLPDSVPDDVLEHVRTNAFVNAPPKPSRGQRPLIVLSPGFGLPRSSLSGLATELASNGYVVAAVDHVHESYGTSLPGGRFATCAACDVEDYGTVPPNRTADVSYVLDRLLSDGSPWRYDWLIDENRIGVAGHSIGGNSAATAMAADHRIDAGVNLDGSFFDHLDKPLSRPFMLLGTPEMLDPSNTKNGWPRAWHKLQGPRYWFSVDGSTHFSFIDFPPLIDQLGLPNPYPITGERSMAITRAYVGAFFDRHLRGRPGNLLDAESPRFDEVELHH